MVVILWSFTFGQKNTEGPPGVEAPAVQPVASETQPSRSGDREPEVAGSGPTAASEEVLEPVEATSEESFAVETERFLAEFTNRGAQLRSVRLKDHLDDNGEPFELIRPREGELLPFGLVTPDGEGLAVNTALYACRRSEKEGERVLEFEYRGTAGSVLKRFTIEPDGFVRFEIEHRGRAPWGVFFGPGVGHPSEVQLGQAQYWRGAVYLKADDRETVDARKARELESVSARSLQWIGLDDQYFLASVIPGAGVREVALQPFLMGSPGAAVATPRLLPRKSDLSDEDKKEVHSLGLILRAADERVEGSSYWGAKSYDVLAALPYDLERAVDYGWFSFLARPLQLGLNFIHDRVVSNYGWAIVLMTLVIRFLMLPLTYQSMKSSQKMQQLNPKVQAIRAKYRGKVKDRQGRPNVEAQRKMQDEIMQVYKGEGVNPASGCLPMVFQIPVFLAYYQLLGKAIELRHAPWLGWVQDLSVMDPFYVLPIVMFATQFVQQLRMPMGTDPMQRRLFLLMPFLFLFLFLKFPAGLVLYWLTNNVFTIGQQEVYKLLGHRGPVTDDANSGSRSKKRSTNA